MTGKDAIDREDIDIGRMIGLLEDGERAIAMSAITLEIYRKVEKLKRVQLLRDVSKDGSYSTRYGINRIVWYVRTGGIPRRALCISIGTYDIIICYRKLKVGVKVPT